MVLVIYIFGDIGIYIGFGMANSGFLLLFYANKKWQINFPNLAISYGCLVVAVSCIMVSMEVNLLLSFAVTTMYYKYLFMIAIKHV